MQSERSSKSICSTMYKGHYQPQISSARLKHNKNKVSALITMISKEKSISLSHLFKYLCYLSFTQNSMKDEQWGDFFFFFCLFAFKILTFSPLVAEIYNTDERAPLKLLPFAINSTVFVTTSFLLESTSLLFLL